MDQRPQSRKTPIVAKRVTLRDQIFERVTELVWLIYIGILYIWAFNESASEWIERFIPSWCIWIAWLPMGYFFVLSVRAEFHKWKRGDEFDGFSFFRAGFIGVSCLIGVYIGIAAIFRG